MIAIINERLTSYGNFTVMTKSSPSNGNKI